jgi:hypothetical protein
MLEIDTQKLNEKLLKFAGWSDISEKVGRIPGYEKEYRNNWYEFLPDLVNDANAQIKWLYPELFKQDIVVKTENHHDTSWVKLIQGVGFFTYEYKLGKFNPALAFALAVEKYIDATGGR